MDMQSVKTKAARSTKRVAAMLALTMAAAAALGGCVGPTGGTGPQVTDDGQGKRVAGSDRTYTTHTRLPIR